jgi:hypothetical protein
LGFGWLAALRHVPHPFPPVDLILELQTKAYGRPLMGYWKFFEQESCPSISEKNVSVRATVLISIDNKVKSWNPSFLRCIRTTQMIG